LVPSLKDEEMSNEINIVRREHERNPIAHGEGGCGGDGEVGSLYANDASTRTEGALIGHRTRPISMFYGCPRLERQFHSRLLLLRRPSSGREPHSALPFWVLLPPYGSLLSHAPAVCLVLCFCQTAPIRVARSAPNVCRQRLILCFSYKSFPYSPLHLLPRLYCSHIPAVPPIC